MNMAAVINGVLCLAALAFPFSVAGTNVALGVALGLGLVSRLWWQGLRQCWCDAKHLMLALGLYFAVMIAGLLWSLDVAWGVHVLQRQWFWLLVPLVACLLGDEAWRRRVLIALSAGLAANLLFCVLQAFGYVSVTTGGSGAQDATGHIGHIGFGMVYGIWAAWLLHLGWQWQGWWRWGAWLLAAWSYVMVFAAQGRGGYIVALLLALVVIYERFRGEHAWRPLAIIAALLLCAGITFAMGPGKERWQQVWDAMSHIEYSQLDASDATLKQTSTGQRLQMLKVSIDVWLAHPWLGAGTGGVPVAVSMLYDDNSFAGHKAFAHPHNQYVFNLARWGVGGLLVLLALYYCWQRVGWRAPWQRSAAAYPLIALSGGGLMLHALFAPAMEEHFSGVLAVLLLGAGLSTLKRQQ